MRGSGGASAEHCRLNRAKATSSSGRACLCDVLAGGIGALAEGGPPARPPVLAHGFAPRVVDDRTGFIFALSVPILPAGLQAIRYHCRFAATRRRAGLVRRPPLPRGRTPRGHQQDTLAFGAARAPRAAIGKWFL
jgi:hypothetical protein